MRESDGVKREKIRVLICGHDGSRTAHREDENFKKL